MTNNTPVYELTAAYDTILGIVWHHDEGNREYYSIDLNGIGLKSIGVTTFYFEGEYEAIISVLKTFFFGSYLNPKSKELSKVFLRD